MAHDEEAEIENDECGFPEMEWQLLGSDDAVTPDWLRPLLGARGIAGEWRARGIPFSEDDLGNPAALRVCGRYYGFAAIDPEDESYVDAPHVSQVATSVPDPIPAEEPEE